MISLTKLGSELLANMSAPDIPQGLSPTKIALIKGLSGALGAGFSQSILFPLENIKIRIIVDNSKDNKTSNSMWKTILKIMKEESLSGFFVGLVPFVIYSISSWGVFFLLSEYTKNHFKLTSSQTWIQSVFAGVATTLICSPLSMVSNYIVAQRKNGGKNLNYISAFPQIYKDEGLWGFYNGLLYSLILVINPTINMQAFEVLKPILPKFFNKDFALFLAGALSKLIATLITYPLQTLKTAMQSGSSDHRSSLKQLLFIIQEFGPLGLFKGLSAKVIHTVLQSAIMLFMTEKINSAVVNTVKNL